MKNIIIIFIINFIFNFFQIKPNQEVLKKIFEIFDDSNENEKLEFKEFIKFVFLLLKGSQKQRINFIFRFIAGKNKSHFTFVELKNFYARVNNTFSYEYRHEAETDMALTVFQLMDMNQSSKIQKEDFIDFLKSNPNLFDLFDILEINLEKGKQLKIENSLGNIHFIMIILRHHF